MFKGTSLMKEPSKGSKPKETSSSSQTTPKRTKLIVKYDCGFNNSLYIRGQGAFGLSWNKGIPLKNSKPDEWIFETDIPFTQCEYKILINDEIYEGGPNHILTCGTTTQHSPQF